MRVDRRARAVANVLVLSSDSGAKDANPYYWHRMQRLMRPVVEAAERQPALRRLAARLSADPGSRACWAEVCTTTASLLLEQPAGVEGLCEGAWALISRSRLDYHVGELADGEAETADFAALAELPPVPQLPPRLPPGPQDPRILVVVPFRDRTEDGARARNLAACLRSLADQSVPREQYLVTVVESDDRPRWRDLVAFHGGQHLFAENAGPFNKSWAVNVGAVNTTARAPLICVLDADSLVDRDFLRRNDARFQRPGTGAFLPYRDMLYLDDRATGRAIHERCIVRRPVAARELLRGFAVHRPPGGCVWLRRDVFESVGGMDERYEGWGREDMDFVLRLQLATALEGFDDPMLHLHHPSSAALVGGQTLNAHIPWLSWSPQGPIGELDRYER